MAGRNERIAAEESQVAARAREAADRARAHAEEWLDLAPGRKRAPR
jgi:hypothetical protein